jgi:hypothetical protein
LIVIVGYEIAVVEDDKFECFSVFKMGDDDIRIMQRFDDSGSFKANYN